MYTKIQYFLLNENIQQAKSILKSLNLDPTKEVDFKEITKSLNKLPNLIGKFVQFQYVDKSPKEDVKRVMSWILNNRDSVAKLPKNILQYETLEELEDDIEHLKRDMKINKFYKGLYASMRGQVDKLDKDKRKEFDDLALAYMDLPEAKQKQFTPLKYFERNNISITDFIKSLANFLDNSEVDEDKKNVLDKIEKYSDIEVLYNMNNILVIETENFEAVKNLGSPAWCIVYGGDSYRNSYFGPDTNNTQLIIFNFNLPATSSNSMFGITIKPTMDITQCQDKMNHYIGVDKIKELTRLPDDIFKPNEIKVAMYKVDNTLKSFVEGMSRLSDKNTLDIPSIIKRLVEKLNELDDPSVKDNIDNIIAGTLKKILTAEYLIQVFVVNTFGSKKPEEIYKLIKDTKYLDIVLKKSIDYRNIVYTSMSFDNIQSCQFFVQYYLELIGDEQGIIDGSTWTRWYLTKRNKMNIQKIWEYTDLNNIDNQKLPVTISSDVKEVFINLFTRIRNDISEEIINHPKDIREFSTYKKIYDSVKSNEDYPYQYFLEQNLYLDASVRFIGEEEYRNFLVDIINKIKDEEEAIDYESIITDICQNAINDYSYDLLDKYDDEFVELYEKTGTKPPEKDHILGLMMYRKTDKYSQIFRDQMKIKKIEGQDCVFVSDFTSFDDLIFKEEYFNSLEDYDTYFERYDDNTMENYADELDNYNLIEISEQIQNECSEVNLITDEIRTKYYIDGKLDRAWMDRYDRTEKQNSELLKLEKDFIKLVFNTDEDELDEINEDLANFLEEDIKKEIFNRAMNDAYNNSYHEEIWNKLIESIADSLGGGYWDLTDEDRRLNKKADIYKFVKSDPDKPSELAFTVDISYLAGEVESYSDLYYNQGDNFDWEELVKYLYKIVGDPVKMYFDNVYGSIDKVNLNDAIRNL
jgi:hypothetical protein